MIERRLVVLLVGSSVVLVFLLLNLLTCLRFASVDDIAGLDADPLSFNTSMAGAGTTDGTSIIANLETVNVNQVSDEVHLQQHPHPNAGAKDAQGNWGYIHDARFLHRQPTLHPFTITDNERNQICAPPGRGPEGHMKAAYKLLTRHIQIPDDTEQEQNSNIKLFCAVYTHASSSDMTVAALETWARRCDGFLAASTVTDAARGMVHIPHGGDHFGQYKGIWQKVRSMMTYIYNHYGTEYDYFHFNGDDVFLIVENLKVFLHEKRPRYVGMWRSPHHMDHWRNNLAEAHPDFYYPLGGAGYTMSQETLRLLVQELLPVCEETTDESEEDYYVARCLWPAGIRAEPYWDETDANLYNPGGWNFYKMELLHGWSWKESYQIIAEHHKLPRYPKSLPEAISRRSVSFHLVETPAYMRRYERLIYRRNTETDCGSVIAHEKLHLLMGILFIFIFILSVTLFFFEKFGRKVKYQPHSRIINS